MGRKEWQNITGSNIPTPPKSHSTNFVPLSTENSSLISDSSSGNQKYALILVIKCTHLWCIIKSKNDITLKDLKTQ